MPSEFIAEGATCQKEGPSLCQKKDGDDTPLARLIKRRRNLHSWKGHNSPAQDTKRSGSREIISWNGAERLQ